MIQPQVAQRLCEQGRGVPRCGRTDDVALGQLFVVTGASGSGKTAAFGPLARRLRDRCATFDSDLLMDAAGALSGSPPIDCAAFRSAWLAVFVASCIVSRTTSHNPSAERTAGSGPGQPRHDHRS